MTNTLYEPLMPGKEKRIFPESRFGISHLTNIQVTSLALLRFFCVMAVIAKDTEMALRVMATICAFPLFCDLTKQWEFTRSSMGRKKSIEAEMAQTKHVRFYQSGDMESSFFKTVKLQGEDQNAWIYSYTHTDQKQYQIEMNSSKTELYDQIRNFINIHKDLQSRFSDVPMMPTSMNFMRRYFFPHTTEESDFSSKVRLLGFPIGVTMLILWNVLKKSIIETTGEALFWMIAASSLLSVYESFLLNEQKFRLSLSGIQRCIPEHGNFASRALGAQYLFVGQTPDLDESLGFLINMKRFLEEKKQEIPPQWRQAGDSLEGLIKQNEGLEENSTLSALSTLHSL